MNKKVTIIGAGPTGLSCAWLLAQNNVTTTVIEKTDLIGGVSATLKYKDMALDLGPHRFTPHTQEILDIVKQLCGPDLQLQKQNIKVFLKNKYFDYPLRAFEIASGLSLLYPILFLFSYFSVLIRHIINPKPEKSYQDWVVNRFGNGIYNLCFRPIAKKTWGRDPNQISYVIAKQRISLPSLGKMIIDMLRETLKLKKKNTIINPLFPEGYFYYPQPGIGQICEQMAVEITNNHGTITTNSQPEKICLENNKVKYIIVNGKEIATDFLMSTMPLSELVSAITPAPPKEVLEAAQGLKFRSIILLFLVVNKDKISDNIAIFFPEEEFIFGRIGEQKNFSRATVPEGKTAICVEITAEEGDTLWDKDDNYLFNHIIPDLERIGLLTKNDVTEYFTKRIKCTYPLYDLNFENRLNNVLNYIASIENLITNGRPGLFKYNNLHHSIEMGLLAAKHILSEKQKNEVWKKSTQLFEEYCMVE